MAEIPRIPSTVNIHPIGQHTTKVRQTGDAPEHQRPQENPHQDTVEIDDVQVLAEPDQSPQEEGESLLDISI